MSMNRMWNVSNPWQGDAKRVLCVCSAGLLRSPTAAKVLYDEYGYNTRAAGLATDCSDIPRSKREKHRVLGYRGRLWVYGACSGGTY